MSWLIRETLPNALSSGEKNTLLFSGDPGEQFLPLTKTDLLSQSDLSQAALMLTELKATDNVLVALQSNGSPAIQLLAQAMLPLVKGVALAGARGRLRLLKTIRELKPKVLVITPSGALDFLARLYMEFNVDPYELGIEKILLVGEIASPGTHQRLISEFEAQVYDVYCDPFFGTALACCQKGEIREAESGVLSLVHPVLDEEVSSSLINTKNKQIAEILLNPVWCSSFKNQSIRTGQLVSSDNAAQGCFQHTVGTHPLVRGCWFSVPLLEKALQLIDGVSSWCLELDRGDGTLDRAELKVGLNRPTLVENPMWAARLRESAASVTPIDLSISTYLLEDELVELPWRVEDLRGHHLAMDRALINAMENKP